jgi:hypothetical protein
LSEVETAIAVAGTLGGSLGGLLLGYILEERIARNRLKRETALGPRLQKQKELTEAYHAMVDLGLAIHKSSKGSENRAKIKEAFDSYDVAFVRAMLWVSSNNFDAAAKANFQIRRIAQKKLSGADLSAKDNDEFNSRLAAETVTITEELKLNLLHDQLRKMFAESETSD